MLSYGVLLGMVQGVLAAESTFISIFLAGEKNKSEIWLKGEHTFGKSDGEPGTDKQKNILRLIHRAVSSDTELFWLNLQWKNRLKKILT